MGSVIGLAGAGGQGIAQFNYDSFGNLRNASGAAASLPGNAGGDFRFQGQWLDEATGLYNFRARYYDPETGRFMSYDPIDLIEMEPESSNPYQFVYNNPHVYSDPTGMFSIAELNSTINGHNVLSTLQTYAGQAARDFIQEKTSQVVGNIMMNASNKLLPGNAIADTWATVQSGVSGGFENFLKDNICSAFKGLGRPFSERLWIEAAVSSGNGKPQSNGLNCEAESIGRIGPHARGASHPDFIIKDGYPYSSRSGRPTFRYRNPKSYLIGDLKASTEAALRDINDNDNQWLAISKYANKYQALPFALYATFMRSFTDRPLTDSQLAAKTVEAQKNAFKKGVVLYILTIYD
jgi:RHS repeat-associated protein